VYEIHTDLPKTTSPSFFPKQGKLPTPRKCAMPNSQKALKRGSAEVQTQWCIAEASQNRSVAVLNLRGLQKGVQRARGVMDDSMLSVRETSRKHCNLYFRADPAHPPKLETPSSVRFIQLRTRKNDGYKDNTIRTTIFDWTRCYTEQHRISW